MDQVWFVAALWLCWRWSLFCANWFRISTALSEIVVGTVAQLVIGALIGSSAWARRRHGSRFWPAPARSFSLSWQGRSSIPEFSGRNGKNPWRWAWSDSSVRSWRGRVAHFRARIGACTASWLAGVALSTTSVAVVYAVMLELGLNQTDLRQGHPGGVL